MNKDQTLNEIVLQIKYEIQQMQPFDYHVEKEKLLNLTDKQADIAIRYNIPIGLCNLRPATRGNSAGKYGFTLVNSMESLQNYRALKYGESEPAISPYFREPSKIVAYIKQIEQLEQSGLRPRLFIDMDGTMAEFNKVAHVETLYEKGYFRNLKPMEKMVQGVKMIIRDHPEIEVFTLSAYLTDSNYALEEKKAWLNEHLPEIDAEHRVFCPCGEDKSSYVPGGIRDTDYLLDDYTKNLLEWEPLNRGIKVLNGINHTRGTWQGDCIRADRSPHDLKTAIVGVVKGQMHIRDTNLQLDVLRDSGMELLSRLESFRQKNENSTSSADWAIRMCQGMVAQSYGYQSRNEWSEGLNETKVTEQPSEPQPIPAVQLKLEESPGKFEIKCFHLKDGVVRAEVQYKGETLYPAVMKQGDKCYVRTGSAIHNTLERHDFTEEEQAMWKQYQQARQAQQLQQSQRTYAIFQLKPGEENRYRRFVPLAQLMDDGELPHIQNYNLVYSGAMMPQDNLDSLFERFNVRHPADFKGHSLSVSDIIVINDAQGQKAHYVDISDFKHVPEFFSPQSQIDPRRTAPQILASGYKHFHQQGNFHIFQHPETKEYKYYTTKYDKSPTGKIEVMFTPVDQLKDLYQYRHLMPEEMRLKMEKSMKTPPKSPPAEH